MSSIVERAFDKSQKIIRAVFLGAPNLVTTSDLNRQFANARNQMDTLDEKTGVVSDMAFAATHNGTTWSITPTYSYLESKGCAFSPVASAMSLVTSSPAYICLVASTETATFSSDATHLIAGATFSDGSSKASANQLRYTGESLTVVTNPAALANLVAVLGYVYIDNAEPTPIKVVSYCNLRNASIHRVVDEKSKELLSRIRALENSLLHTVVKGTIIMWGGGLSGKVSLEAIKNSIPYGYVPCGKLAIGIATKDAEYAAWSSYVSELGYSLPSTGVNAASPYVDFSLISGLGIPNLTDKFVISAGNIYSSGSTGGDKEITLNEAQIPSHNHVYQSTNHNEGRSYPYTKKDGTSGTLTMSSVGTGAAQNDVDGNDLTGKVYETSKTGGSEAHSNMPPYYGLFFLSKVI